MGGGGGDLSRTSSLSSITDSTMSLNIITVTLPMDSVSFLGISIVGQSNHSGDGGIFVGSVRREGVVSERAWTPDDRVACTLTCRSCS